MARHMFRNRLGELIEIPEVAATQAKNSFGELLDRVAVSGAVAITRHDTPKAVLLSFEEFESLSSARSESLDALSGKFEGLLERLQTPAARKGLEAAFHATPAELGRAAVEAARRRRSVSDRPRIYVLAGVNGAGKSSIGGAAIRASGADYYNPDEAARDLMAAQPGLTLAEANAAAWQISRTLLERAIQERLDFAFETTLGGNTIPRLLGEAAKSGIEILVWYVGLESPQLHIERVAARVRRSGHPIPEETIRRRYERSRLNLIQLLPSLTALRVYDNSDPAEPEAGGMPAPRLVLHLEAGRILGPEDLSQTPDWAKPIVVAALQGRLE